MTLFWTLCIALLVLCAVFLLYPVWSAKRYVALSIEKAKVDRTAQNVEIFQDRLGELELEYAEGKLSQLQFEQLKTELQASLLADAETETAAGEQANDPAPVVSPTKFQGLGLAFGLSLAIVVASFLLYFQWGEYDRAAQYMQSRFTNAELAQARQSAEAGDMDGLIEQLRAKLKQNPDNLEGWSLLARSAMNLENFSVAEEGFLQVARLLEQQGQSQAAVFGLVAQARFFGANAGITEPVQDMLDRALALDANESYSLGLLAIDAYDRGAFEQAVAYWERILVASPQHPSRSSIESAIVRAKQQAAAGESGQASAAPAQLSASEVPADSAEQAQITVTVSLHERLASEVGPNDAVFIFARAPDGPPLPLAASRHTVSELPLTVVLNDAKAMAPMAKLSNVQAANVVARISKTGQAIAAAGDLQGVQAEVSVFANAQVELVIDQKL